MSASHDHDHDHDHDDHAPGADVHAGHAEHDDHHDHAHDHGHDDHDHGHDHDHHHHAIDPRTADHGTRRAMQISLIVTIVFMATEAIGGWLANSLALIADAGHMLTDAASLGLALFAIYVSARPPNERRTFGYLRAEILAAFVNGCALVVIALGIFWECAQRIRAPEAVDVRIMLPVAVAGLIANAFSAWLLHGAHEHQLNARAAYLHILGDLFGAAAAILAALVIWGTGWTLADPILSAVVGVLMIVGAVRIVQQSVEVLLEAVPAHIDLHRLERELGAVEGVSGVHDLHVWTIASGLHVLTCHAVVIEGRLDYYDTLERLTCVVRDRFKIDHATFQLECAGFQAKEHGIAHCARPAAPAAGSSAAPAAGAPGA